MIRRVGFKNFRVLADVELELEPFTVLVGPNASGKSTILDGLNRIAYMRKLNVHSLVQGAAYKRSEKKQWVFPSNLTTKSKAEKFLEFSFQADRGDTISVGFEGDEKSIWSYLVLVNKQMNLAGDQPWVGDYVIQSSIPAIAYQRLPNSAHLRLHGENIAKPSYSDAPSANLLPDGKGLASVLSDVKLGDSQRFERIQKGLRTVVPHVVDVRIEGATVGPENWIDHNHTDLVDSRETRKGYRIVIDFDNAKGIPADAVSEGTLFALAILTVATDSENDWLILLDDLERGLHPRACGDLVKVLRNLVREFPKLQIVATTHSPYLLNFVEPEEVRVVTLSDEGHTVVANLTDHPDYDHWKDSMMPGEFWGWAGEDWVKERRAKKGKPEKTL